MTVRTRFIWPSTFSRTGVSAGRRDRLGSLLFVHRNLDPALCRPLGVPLEDQLHGLAKLDVLDRLHAVAEDADLADRRLLNFIHLEGKDEPSLVSSQALHADVERGPDLD